MSATYMELLAKFSNADHQKFIKDMRRFGVKVGVYAARGSFGKEGPCAYTDDEHDAQDIIRATKVKLRQDTLGKRYVLYP